MRRARHLVAVAETASGLPEFHSAAQSSPRFVGQILQEERVHRALQPNVQVRDVPLGKRDDVHAGEGETLEESSSVFLVPAESVQRLREHDIESSVQRVPHHCLESAAQERGSRESVIRELVDDRPALSHGELAAYAQLVRDRGVPLVVRGVPSLDGDLHCTVTSGAVPCRAPTSRSNDSRAACRARMRTSIRNGSSR